MKLIWLLVLKLNIKITVRHHDFNLGFLKFTSRKHLLKWNLSKADLLQSRHSYKAESMSSRKCFNGQARINTSIFACDGNCYIITAEFTHL